MKIAILMHPNDVKKDKVTSKSAKQMKAEAEARGHEAQIILAKNISLIFDVSGTELYYQGKILKLPDVVINWVGILNNVNKRMYAVREMELKGVPVVNSFFPVTHTRNKFHTFQLLSDKNFPVIRTILISDKKHLDFAVKKLGGFPIIAKTIFGNEGKGVTIFESKRSLVSGIELLLENNLFMDFIQLQEYVESANRDYRLFVVGDKVVAQMEREAPKDDFRSNLSAGGTGKPSHLPAEVTDLAVKAAGTLKLDVAGVDIIITPTGPKICEVNPRPGFLIAEITGVNVAKEIVKMAEKKQSGKS
jgi:ribosomal protein S6--L-glutamate ligase